ncbi:asparagine synthetase B family protein, partial [Thermodesulfobacteriota bacterium]
GLNILRYWDVDFHPKRDIPIEDLIEEFVELLKRSVKLRLISDVPLGAFLSGGIDSSLVVRLMSEVADLAPRTFSIGFEDSIYDESPFAEMAARNANAVHHNFPVRANIGDILEQIIEAFDEPFADDGAIPCFYICRETRREVKVALSGLGGDELFGGYNRYLGFHLSQFASRVPLSRSRVWQRLVDSIPESRDGGYTVDRIKRFVSAMHMPASERYVHYLYNIDRSRRADLYNQDIASKIDGRVNEEELIDIFRSSNFLNEIDNAYYLDFRTYLPEDVLALTDRMSMWHSLEVRVPFLDHNLVEFSASLYPALKIRGHLMKYFLKKAASSFLPAKLLNKRKQGFVGPLPVWLMNELKDFTMETLSESNLGRHGIFNIKMVQQILYEHMNLKRKNETLIWSLLIFDHWHRKYME